MTHASATVDMMQPPYPAERGLDVYNTKLGMWVFLASEVMFFAALIGTYVILRFGAPGEWARPGIVLNIKVTAFNTFLLICSSVSMVKAYAAIADGDPRRMRFWLLLTATMGLYGSTFFTMTGFHGFHVTCGVVSMLYLYVTKALPGKITPQDYAGIEVVGLYWHFVDLVWIILFTIVYLI